MIPGMTIGLEEALSRCTNKAGCPMHPELDTLHTYLGEPYREVPVHEIPGDPRR